MLIKMTALLTTVFSHRIIKLKANFDGELEQLDEKLSAVLRRQEYEYLQAYNIYVKKKEKELRMLITTL